jgi:hypothetical protein
MAPEWQLQAVRTVEEVALGYYARDAVAGDACPLSAGCSVVALVATVVLALTSAAAAVALSAVAALAACWACSTVRSMG